MPKTNLGREKGLEELRIFASLSLEELAKFMTDQGLFGSTFLDDNDIKDMKQLEKHAKQSLDC